MEWIPRQQGRGYGYVPLLTSTHVCTFGVIQQKLRDNPFRRWVPDEDRDLPSFENNYSDIPAQKPLLRSMSMSECDETGDTLFIIL